MNTYINKKTKEKYYVENFNVINSTNRAKNCRMILYRRSNIDTREGNIIYYVREEKEFFEKFEVDTSKPEFW